MKHLKLFESKSPEPFKKTFKCKNVIDATNFIKRIMYLAEKDDHHPSILVNKFTVTVELFTHSEGKVTDKDFDMMEQIQNLYLKL